MAHMQGKLLFKVLESGQTEVDFGQLWDESLLDIKKIIWKVIEKSTQNVYVMIARQKMITKVTKTKITRMAIFIGVAVGCTSKNAQLYIFTYLYMSCFILIQVTKTQEIFHDINIVIL